MNPTPTLSVEAAIEAVSKMSRPILLFHPNLSTAKLAVPLMTVAAATRKVIQCEPCEHLPPDNVAFIDMAHIEMETWLMMPPPAPIIDAWRGQTH